jgi:moderate conductance mechanosensitive channel
MIAVLQAPTIDGPNAIAILSALAGLALGLLCLRFIGVRLLRLVARLVPFLGGQLGQWLERRLAQALIAVLAIGCVALLAAGGYLWSRGEHVPNYVRAQLQAVPPEFYKEQAWRLLRVVGAALLAAVLLRPIGRVLGFLERQAVDFRGLKQNDASLRRFFLGLRRLVALGLWISVAVYAAHAFEVHSEVRELLAVLWRVYWILGGGWVAWYAIEVVVISLNAMAEERQKPGHWLANYQKVAHLVPLLRRSLDAILIVIVVTLVVRQIEPIADLAEWGPRLIGVIAIAFLARVLAELVRLGTNEFLLNREGLELEARQRRETIVPLIESGSQYLLYFGAALMILERLSIDSTPFLAGAGIIGLAVGLGAQNLVNDVVSGFFVLFEDYYLVGDYVQIGGSEGVVERIDLRTTRIRDNDGRHHIIRNGEVSTVVNYSKRYTFAVVEVGVAYESDLDKVTTALLDAGRELAAVNPNVLEPTVVKGLIDFGESELRFRTVTRVRPGAHLAVQNQLRERIKAIFDQREIEIPYPKRVLVVKNESPGGGPMGPDVTLHPMDAD